MLGETFTNLIREKINYAYLLVFMLIISFIGIGLQFFEPYPMFWALFPVLLFMFVSVILILQFCLRELQKFEVNCKSEKILKECNSLFVKRNNSLLESIYFFMIIIYFVCLYRMNLIEINLMGLYIFLLGGGTFFLALLDYELYIRLTIFLRQTGKKLSNIEYNFIFPSNTLWLQHFFRLYKILKNAALGVSILFVLENSMLFIANYERHFYPNLPKEKSVLELFDYLPIEWWVIWGFIFTTIIVALPLIIQFQNKSLKDIVLHIQRKFNEELTKPYNINELYANPQKYYFFLKIMQIIENSLKETYLPRSIDKLLSLGASLLTCFAHLISFYMLLISG